MPYSQEAKELAHRIDPDCWVSYSGKDKKFKQSMDARRSAALRAAVARTVAPDTYETEEDIIYWLFVQSCELPSGQYDHQHISAYERAQRYLVASGRIKPEDCVFAD